MSRLNVKVLLNSADHAIETKRPNYQVPVVQKMDSAIQWINHYSKTPLLRTCLAKICQLSLLYLRTCLA